MSQTSPSLDPSLRLSVCMCVCGEDWSLGTDDHHGRVDGWEGCHLSLKQDLLSVCWRAVSRTDVSTECHTRDHRGDGSRWLLGWGDLPRVVTKTRLDMPGPATLVLTGNWKHKRICTENALVVLRRKLNKYWGFDPRAAVHPLISNVNRMFLLVNSH